MHRPAAAIFEDTVSQLKSYLEIATTLETDSALQATIGQLPACVLDGSLGTKIRQGLASCYRSLVTEYGPQKINVECAEFSAMAELLRNLAIFNGGRLDVYTTNYDCALQAFSSRCDFLSFFTHIDNETGEFSNSWFRARPALKGSLPQIYDHRLHGCIAWYAHSQPDGVKEVYGCGEKLEINDDNFLQRMVVKLNGNQEIGKQNVFLRAYQEFYSHLHDATALVIWGSSFRDLEILRAINSACLFRPTPLPIFYVNPDLSQESVQDAIRTRLRAVPMPLAKTFNPERIAWEKAQGTRVLTDMLLAKLSCIKKPTPTPRAFSVVAA